MAGNVQKKFSSTVWEVRTVREIEFRGFYIGADGLRITTDAEGRTVYAVPRKKPRRRQSAETVRSLIKMEEERK